MDFMIMQPHGVTNVMSMRVPPKPVFWTVKHTGTRFVLYSGVKAQVKIPFTHFTYADLPEDLTGCVTIIRDRKETLASWIANKEPVIIANLSAQWEQQEEFLRRGGFGAKTPEEAALALGIPETGFITERAGQTSSSIKRALLNGETPMWPDEYKDFASTL